MELQKVYRSEPEVAKLLTECKGPAITLLQEPVVSWSAQSKMWNLPNLERKNFGVYVHHEHIPKYHHDKVRSAIVCKEVQGILDNVHSGKDVTTIFLRGLNKGSRAHLAQGDLLRITSAYFHHRPWTFDGPPVVPKELRDLSDVILETGLNWLIGADTNSWSPVWSKKENARGRECQEWVDNNGVLECLNIGYPITFERPDCNVTGQGQITRCSV